MIKTMKLLYLFLILFSTLYAQEVGVPSVDKKNISKEFILYRSKDGYAIKDLIHNTDIWTAKFKSEWYECIGNVKLTQIVCKSGDVDSDRIESVNLYKVGQKDSLNILKSKYNVKQMIFSQDGGKLYIYTDGDINERKDNRPISILMMYDLKEQKMIYSVPVLGTGKIYVTKSYILHQDYFHDMTLNPQHTVLNSLNGEMIRKFELKGEYIKDYLNDLTRDK